MMKEVGLMVWSCIKEAGFINHSKNSLQAIKILEERKLQQTFSAHGVNIFLQTKS